MIETAIFSLKLLPFYLIIWFAGLYLGYKMVKTQKIDKCLICEREFLNEHEELIYGIDVEYNLIYCYKCVRKAKKEQNIEIPIKTKSGREYNFKTKKSSVKIK